MPVSPLSPWPRSPLPAMAAPERRVSTTQAVDNSTLAPTSAPRSRRSWRRPVRGRWRGRSATARTPSAPAGTAGSISPAPPGSPVRAACSGVLVTARPGCRDAPLRPLARHALCRWARSRWRSAPPCARAASSARSARAASTAGLHLGVRRAGTASRTWTRSRSSPAARPPRPPSHRRARPASRAPARAAHARSSRPRPSRRRRPCRPRLAARHRPGLARPARRARSRPPPRTIPTAPASAGFESPPPRAPAASRPGPPGSGSRRCCSARSGRRCACACAVAARVCRRRYRRRGDRRATDRDRPRCVRGRAAGTAVAARDPLDAAQRHRGRVGDRGRHRGHRHALRRGRGPRGGGAAHLRASACWRVWSARWCSSTSVRRRCGAHSDPARRRTGEEWRHRSRRSSSRSAPPLPSRPTIASWAAVFAAASTAGATEGYAVLALLAGVGLGQPDVDGDPHRRRVAQPAAGSATECCAPSTAWRASACWASAACSPTAPCATHASRRTRGATRSRSPTHR